MGVGGGGGAGWSASWWSLYWSGSCICNNWYPQTCGQSGPVQECLAGVYQWNVCLGNYGLFLLTKLGPTGFSLYPILILDGTTNSLFVLGMSPTCSLVWVPTSKFCTVEVFGFLIATTSLTTSLHLTNTVTTLLSLPQYLCEAGLMVTHTQGTKLEVGPKIFCCWLSLQPNQYPTGHNPERYRQS